MKAAPTKRLVSFEMGHFSSLQALQSVCIASHRRSPNQVTGAWVGRRGLSWQVAPLVLGPCRYLATEDLPCGFWFLNCSNSQHLDSPGLSCATLYHVVCLVFSLNMQTKDNTRCQQVSYYVIILFTRSRGTATIILL